MAAAPVAEIYLFAATIPAGTPKAAPAVVPMVMPDLRAEWVEWLVPPGPRGNVGFWLGSHGQQIIPFASGPANWIVTDDEKEHWDLDGLSAGIDWELRGYNLGIDPHTIYVRWGLSVPAVVSSPILPTHDVAVLSS